MFIQLYKCSNSDLKKKYRTNTTISNNRDMLDYINALMDTIKKLLQATILPAHYGLFYTGTLFQVIIVLFAYNKPFKSFYFYVFIHFFSFLTCFL